MFKRIRDEAPLYYNESHDFYALSRFDDVNRALVDHQSFSSARGVVLEIIKSAWRYRPVCSSSRTPRFTTSTATCLPAHSRPGDRHVRTERGGQMTDNPEGALARIEGRVALDEIMNRFPEWTSTSTT